MNDTIAGKLYMGIVSDTNRFLYGTNNNTFLIVADLIKKYKLDVESLYRKLYARPLSEIRLMGHIASSLKVDKYGFAHVEIDEDIIKSLGADLAAVSNMINDFNNINEIIVWAFVSRDEKNNKYKVNIRSRGPVINDIASKYNGGGHKYASGVRNESKEAIEQLLKDLSNCCKDYVESSGKDGSN